MSGDNAARTATLKTFTDLGMQGAECLSQNEIDALGNLTLNEIKALIKAQQILPKDAATPANICGGKIF
ncbi:hypothetical protein EQV97_22305 [Pseudomonas sp. TMW22090]|uniref:hypothetical protein n=1 Tax=Pseudomonas sp. TMW22090 TaxID=2506434 RepID=UPI001F101C4E|nr:hypothetical protein [Pseudomonas sp. TMW22090]MCH4880095.1 hypothetical protein [Pseudomonas sp. TMW22090]